jgi:CheY-like chemotaxis protein
LNSILDYTKLAQGNAKASSSVVNLPDMFKTVAELHAATLAAKGLELRTHFLFDPASADVVIDEGKLFEVVSNLVSNAIKFTASGFIALSAELKPRADAPFPASILYIEVKDTGIGMSEADCEKVFTPFYQGESGAEIKAGGTGLGLAIVKELVAVMEGTVDLSSVLGVGTAVRVRLPVTSTDAALKEARKAKEASAQAFERQVQSRVIAFPQMRGYPDTLNGRRALLVEDNDLNVILASATLQFLGLEVVVAENGLDGFHAACDLRFDVILMDCQMPVMDGYESTRRIRAHEKENCVANPIPIIALTARTLLGDRERCLEAGMTDYLAKPYSERELKDLLSRWIPSLAKQG